VNDLEGGGQITNTGAATTLTVNGGNFGGVIAGPLALTVSGALVLFGNNTYTGGTAINGGATLTLGAGGTTGSVAGDIQDHGTLEFRHSGTFVESGVISGSGNLVQDGPGTTVLSAANDSYSGSAYIAGGTLEAQTPSALGNSAVIFLAGAPGTLRIDGMTMPGTPVIGFALGDTIDLANIAATSWSYSGGVLSLTNGGAPVAQLNLSTPFANPLFGLSGDGGSGTDIVLEPPPPQDLNADNRADLVFQTPNNQFLGALSTGGGFTTPQLWVQHGGTFMPGEAQYADVNGDHRVDLIYQGLDNRFYVSLSTGSSFTAPVQWVQHGGSFTPGQAQYADVNGDGRADLIMQGNDNSFYVSLSTGSSFTAPALWVQHGGTFTAGQAQYADVNGDGRADLIMQGSDNRFYVSLSTGSGFTSPVQWMQHGGSFVAGQAQYADVNGDGKYDLLFQGSDNKEYLSLSTGSSFGAPTVVADFGAYGSFQPGTLHA
jgi:autotransporter-associated beta strand protein